MLDFTGLNCPVCGKAFREEDDVVVCPDCGAPYHRACYQQVGECIFTDLHEKGEEWAPPAPPKPETPPASAEIKDAECPICGLLNYHSAKRCVRCGAVLTEEAFFRQQVSPGQNAPLYQARPSVDPGMPFGFGDPMGGVSPAEQLDEGVTFGDASKLVRVNTAYYMPAFRQIRRGRNKFNFTAFLFSGGWMLYRKQYKWGAVITGIMMALHAAIQGVYWLVTWPAMKTLIAQAGIDLSTTYALTAEQYDLLTQATLADPALSMRIGGSVLGLGLLLLLMLAVMIFVGVRGNKMYLNHCVSTIQEARADGEDLQAVLAERGGVSTAVALAVAICFFAVRTLFLMLFGAAL